MTTYLNEQKKKIPVQEEMLEELWLPCNVDVEQMLQYTKGFLDCHVSSELNTVSLMREVFEEYSGLAPIQSENKILFVQSRHTKI